MLIFELFKELTILFSVGLKKKPVEMSLNSKYFKILSFLLILNYTTSMQILKKIATEYN